jgi:hypothetical protein
MKPSDKVKAGFFKNVNNFYLKHINESKFMVGVAMILLNIGTKYVDFKFTKAQEAMLRKSIARELIIFAIVFMGTRDVVFAILLTAAFVVLSEYVFNEKSKYCLVSSKMKNLMASIDLDADGIVSPEEEQKALELLKKAEKNRENHIQSKFSSYLTNMNNNMIVTE